jgi:CheY-like chemotaxis protein
VDSKQNPVSIALVSAPCGIAFVMYISGSILKKNKEIPFFMKESIQIENENQYSEGIVGETDFNPRVLIVDDDVAVRSILSRFLEHEGFQTIVAKDGLEGVELARRYSPDLVIMDVVMPRMNGLQAASLIKYYKPSSDTPLVFLTAKDSAEEIAVAQKARADVYITKPFDARQVTEIVKELLAVPELM